MKKILLFLAISLLLFLTVLPPVLRFILPDRFIEDDTEVVVENEVLNCSSESYIANTVYQNNAVTMIIFKQLKTNPDINLEEDSITDETKVDTEELDELFDDLKTKSNINYNPLEDGDIIEIDFTISNHESINLTKYTSDINTQKEYYENLGFNCLIRR